MSDAQATLWTPYLHLPSCNLFSHETAERAPFFQHSTFRLSFWCWSVILYDQPQLRPKTSQIFHDGDWTWKPCQTQVGCIYRAMLGLVQTGEIMLTPEPMAYPWRVFVPSMLSQVAQWWPKCQRTMLSPDTSHLWTPQLRPCTLQWCSSQALW